MYLLRPVGHNFALVSVLELKPRAVAFLLTPELGFRPDPLQLPRLLGRCQTERLSAHPLTLTILLMNVLRSSRDLMNWQELRLVSTRDGVNLKMQ